MEKEKQVIEKALDSEMVEVKVTLCKPFYQFLKEYLAFFGSKLTVTDICRLMIYDNVNNLYHGLDEWLDSTVTYIEKEAWYNKRPLLAITSAQEEESISKVSVDLAGTEFIKEIIKASEQQGMDRDEFIRFALREQLEHLRKTHELLIG